MPWARGVDWRWRRSTYKREVSEAPGVPVSPASLPDTRAAVGCEGAIGRMPRYRRLRLSFHDKYLSLRFLPFDSM